MPENILIAIAWPYANAEIHVGNITGSHLPGDIVARINGTEIDTVAQLAEVLAVDSDEWELTVERDGKVKTVKVR